MTAVGHAAVVHLAVRSGVPGGMGAVFLAAVSLVFVTSGVTVLHAAVAHLGVATGILIPVPCLLCSAMCAVLHTTVAGCTHLTVPGRLPGLPHAVVPHAPVVALAHLTVTGVITTAPPTGLHTCVALDLRVRRTAPAVGQLPGCVKQFRLCGGERGGHGLR
ncbi:hypothetical protein M3G91_09110 [Micromonospora chalcea]|uniref:hypothetical protein n=1 Tax=Micromonospora chalcea TaxID=1874 RepID=UPI0021A356A9|nr:hypothetical protein [Micromonospora chalcea]MCT2277782.1 hypothetical protein [Micromonospora chalcea]